ncbi:MAG: alpha/beta fold hydrolase, partial [Bacteroidetes bacterium]|nr:alpha/beta fold hydrolase [Bacteroidota bacterium]
DPDLWLKTLENLELLEISTIIPGHGPMGDRGHLVKMVSYLEELIAIRDTLDENQNLNEVPLPKGFQNWHFPEFFRANLGFLARQNLESDQVFQEVGEIENENGIIHYKLRGRGTPILMLSSGPGYSGEYLTPVAGMLGRTDQIILPDLRGTGRSAVRQYNQETINLKNIINDLDSLRKYLELDEWVLLGHGFGGMLAMEYAARFPENTQALILTNSGGTDLRFLQYFGDNYERNLSKSDLDSLWYWENDIRKKKFPDKAWRMHFKIEQSAYLFDPLQVERLIKYFSREEYSQEMGDLLWNDLAANYDPEKGLLNYEGPVLLIAGRQDPMDASTVYQIREFMPQAEIEIIERCGHYPWIEQPRTFYKAIDEFLEELD